MGVFDFQSHIHGRIDAAEAFLRTLVCIDSGSRDVEGIERVGEAVIPRFDALGFKVTEHAARDGAGRHLHFHRAGTGKRLFLGAHLDTVFEDGSFRGFEAVDDIALGPGVVDCKGGVVVLTEILEALSASGHLDDFSVDVVLNGDEETGSYTSRDLIERVAQGSDYALIFEGARPSGAVVSWRRGNGLFTLRAHGTAAHAGVAHADGVNAVEALAHKVIAVQNLTDYDRGLTLNVGTIHGGTKRNIVPDFAEATIDIRYDHAEDGERTDARIRELCASSEVDGARIEVLGGLNRPPWPGEDPAIEGLAAHWLSVAKELGIEATAESTGGGSDGNWTAAMGIPTLDGLGPVGGKYHTVGEYVVRASLPERILLGTTAILSLP